MIEFDDVTVGVPLHRSRPWIDVVAGNIERLAGTAHLIVSDATEDDDALTTLRDRFAGVPGVTWVGARTGVQGWVAHGNDLVDRSRTDLFMWLPHDDEIGPDYVGHCRQALHDDPSLGAVVGLTRSILGPGLDDRPQPSLAAVQHDPVHRLPANDYLARWSLGMLFHALVRRSAQRPLPQTNAKGDWADMIWAYGLCLDWPIREVSSATYAKRYYHGSASSPWSTGFLPQGLPHLMAEIRLRLPEPDRPAATDELVAVFTGLVDEVVTERTARAEALQEHLDWVLNSRSYRLAAVMRSMRDRARGTQSAPGSRTSLRKSE